ncbi:hypothetical protein E0Z10_g1944 [Xylaria hypoxylon]|uniref:Glutamyl-tRNA amidotransferase complex subunit Gta3 domain-containing protein n=1 Tax=Xylaria hypoxylon TaxID=37992 RepID=A0A4Z0Z7D9_9PEZI|nr:hypothetical protein E0Z10_g1944 [Xylaria hypoxylon]
MNSTICSHCRLSLRRAIRASRQQTRAGSTVPASLTRASRTQQHPDTTNSTTPDFASLLSQPTWSVRSLLPPNTSSSQATTITPKTLHHLLRLSALPLPRTPDEESQMLATLSSQLHFVRAIQVVDTTDIAPLRVIRDETALGLREQTIGLAELRDTLESENVVGHARRPRRRPPHGPAHALKQQSGSPVNEGREEVTGQDTARGPNEIQGRKRVPNEEEGWDVLGGASETAGGRYFVVRSGGTSSSSNKTVG